MIPLRLQLKNFLSYGPQEQTINFEPYPLICLSGKNGHGKSALLDAMTWAVWGQARKTSNTTKADNDLLRIGQTFMTISFDFAFNGQTYRIKREYGKTFAKPYASLDFGIIDDSTQKVRSLTEKTIRSTQDKIEKTIGIDYETFINTAFFKQGHANEFSKKSPKERKDILASILNLNHYEDLKKYIQEKTREYTTKEQYLTETLQSLKQTLEKRDAVLQEHDSLNVAYETLIRQEQKFADRQHVLAADLVITQEKLQRFEQLTFQLVHLKNLEKQHQSELVSMFTAWRHANQQRRALPDRTNLEQEKNAVRDFLEKEQCMLQQHLRLKEMFLQIKEEKQVYEETLKEQYHTTIQQKKISIERLLAQKMVITHQLQTYDMQAQTAKREITALEQQKVTLQKKLVSHNQQTLKESEQLFEKRKAHYHRWVSYLQRIHQEQKERAQKQLFTHNSDNPSCPLCEQNLSASRKNFLKAKFLAQERFSQHQRTRLEKVTKSLKEILIQHHAELQKLYQDQKDQENLVRQLEELNSLCMKLDTQHGQARKKYTESIHEQIMLEQVIAQEQALLHQEELAAKKSCEQDKNLKVYEKKLKNLEKELQETTYNAARYQELTKNLETIQQQLQLYENQQAMQATQEQRKLSITNLICSLKKLKTEQQKLLLEQQTVVGIKEKQKKIVEQQKDLSAQQKQCQQEKETIVHHKGRIEEQTKYLEKQQEELDSCQQKIKELTQTLFECTALTSALGKNGIQALLIEEALPEIEQEANLLLGQLTDNQTHIIIESVRDLKKGGTRETLDINISDPMGIRPYELFSGGEAFRIDFALRIAISKLLARRAGTSLQTLIIDEGFGSQDEEGLSRLMDAIYKIQNNFSKIIIVSHLSAMKDQFPVHFVISKGPQGSLLNVLEQD